jgi:hypothetical protein
VPIDRAPRRHASLLGNAPVPTCLAIPRFPEGPQFGSRRHRRFRKPPLSSRSVGFPENRSATLTIPADLPVRAQAKVVTDIHPSLRRLVSLLGSYIQNICPAQSLQSLRSRLIPCPAGFHRRAGSLLPGRHWPHVTFEPFGTQHIPCNATSTGGDISGGRYSLMFRLPRLPGPRLHPPAQALACAAAGPFTPRNLLVGYLPQAVVSLRIQRATDAVGLSPAELQPCRLLPNPCPRGTAKSSKAHASWERPAGFAATS